MIKREACPQCGSRQYKRNGRIHTGKQNHKCKACGRAFVLVPENHVITEEQRAVIERLLLERISLRGICRVIGVGLRWLLYFMVERFTAAPDASVYPADSGHPKSDPASAGSRGGRALELCREESEPAVGLDCYGCYDSPSHCLPRRGS